MIQTAAGWELEVDRGPACVLIKARRKAAEAGESPSLVDQVWEVLDRHLTYRLVLEFDKVGDLDHDLVVQLLELHSKIDHHQGMLRICGLCEHSRELLRQRLKMVGYEDREEALLGHAAPRHPR